MLIYTLFKWREYLTDFVLNIQGPHAKAWLETVIKTLSHVELTRVVVTLWAVWHSRRENIHDSQSMMSANCFIDRFISDLHPAEPEPARVSTVRALFQR
jgi:hypothetical protein